MELTEDEKWIIIENVSAAYMEWEDEGKEESNCEEMKKIGQVLDKLSPNWRKADSCAEVKSFRIEISEE